MHIDQNCLINLHITHHIMLWAPFSLAFMFHIYRFSIKLFNAHNINIHFSFFSFFFSFLFQTPIKYLITTFSITINSITKICFPKSFKKNIIHNIELLFPFFFFWVPSLSHISIFLYFFVSCLVSKTIKFCARFSIIHTISLCFLWAAFWIDWKL